MTEATKEKRMTTRSPSRRNASLFPADEATSWESGQRSGHHFLRPPLPPRAGRPDATPSAEAEEAEDAGADASEGAAVPGGRRDGAKRHGEVGRES